MELQEIPTKLQADRWAMGLVDSKRFGVKYAHKLQGVNAIAHDFRGSAN